MREYDHRDQHSGCGFALLTCWLPFSLCLWFLIGRGIWMLLQ